jgi:hypothetical protein
MFYAHCHGAGCYYKEDPSVKTGNFPKSSGLLEIWEHHIRIYKNSDFSAGLSGLKA